MPSKFDRSLRMSCPTCGYDQFAHEEGDIVTCQDCGLIISKSDLAEANGSKINQAVEEMANDVARDSAARLKKAFGKWS